MKVGSFHRQRIRIERRFPAGAKRRKAMGHLVREARAAMLVVGSKAVGWRLPDGSVACAKHRWPNKAAADSELDRIASVVRGGMVPIRSYPCEFCGGWHTTHQRRNRDVLHSNSAAGL